MLERLADLTHAVIERQPGRNPTMCRIQHWLEAFFVSWGVPLHTQDSAHKLRFAATTSYWSGPADLSSYHDVRHSAVTRRREAPEPPRASRNIARDRVRSVSTRTERGRDRRSARRRGCCRFRCWFLYDKLDTDTFGKSQFLEHGADGMECLGADGR